MERERSVYHTASKSFPNKILLGLGSICLPVAFGFAAYFWLSKKTTAKKGEALKACHRVRKGIPPGLINHGNTCFINSLLQALSAVEDFCKWIGDLDYDKDKILLCSLKEITKVLNNKQDSEKDLFSALDIIESLSAHGWVGTSQQQDAHEFFQVLTSTLDDELATLEFSQHGLALEDGYSRQLDGIINRACRELKAMPAPIESPFKGCLANRMACLSCGYQSVRFEPFESISLRIPSFAALTGASLDSCLAEFTKSEQIDDVICPNCTKVSQSRRPIKTQFLKQLSFAKLPKCICLHIQRSYFLPNGSSYKNDQFVRFTDVMDISPYRYTTATNKDFDGISLLEKRSSEKRPFLRGGCSKFPEGKTTASVVFPSSLYRLKSAIVHIGEVFNGHFVTYRRAVNTVDDWIYSSDECTKLVAKQSVLSSNAYVLFYERTLESLS